VKLAWPRQAQVVLLFIGGDPRECPLSGVKRTLTNLQAMVVPTNGEQAQRDCTTHDVVVV